MKVIISLCSYLGTDWISESPRDAPAGTGTGGSKQRNRRCGERHSLQEFLLTPGDGVKCVRSGMGA